MWNRIAADMPTRRSGRDHLPAAPRRKQWFAVIAGCAAVAVLAFGLHQLGRYEAVGPRDQKLTVEPRPVVAPRGHRAEMTLADGSKVVLGAGSTLRVSSAFGKTTREVYLEGEAYFDIVHDPGHPFRVHTRWAVTEDVGTRFGVVAFPGDTMEHVIVETGSVIVRDTAGRDIGLLLRSQDLVRLTRGGDIHAAHGVDVESYLAWTHGVIRFDNEMLANAIPVLEREYDLHIRVTDPTLARTRFTAPFTAGRVNEMLQGLAFALNARYDRQGQSVTLSLPRR